MKIDINKLRNKTTKSDGRIVAQCPACAFCGNDSKGEHLIVYLDGRFGCVANPGDKNHNREILNLVGKEDESVIERRVTLRPYKSSPSSLLQIVPRFTLEQLGYQPNDVKKEETAKK